MQVPLKNYDSISSFCFYIKLQGSQCLSSASESKEDLDARQEQVEVVVVDSIVIVKPNFSSITTESLPILVPLEPIFVSKSGFDFVGMPMLSLFFLKFLA